MDRFAQMLHNRFGSQPDDRRPRVLRRFLPTSFACSVPLTGTQMAKIHLTAYH